jgi:diguanylate cyclase (GGDEF)-like protein
MTLLDSVLLATVAAAAGTTGGFFLGRIGLQRLRRDLEGARADLSRAEAQGREQARQVHRLRNDQRWLSNLSRYLPNVVRELNKSDVGARQIPPLVISLVDAIFEPEQITMYQVRAVGEGETREKEMFLTDQRGLLGTSVPRRIRFGEGKVGWVAESGVEMLAEDWSNLTRTEGRAIDDNHPALRLDMIAPIVQHEEGADRVVGVLTVGNPAIRPRDEKLMLQMVTNLASIAMTNAENHRKLSVQAHTDGLTGLMNKRHFLKERFGLMIHEAERAAERVAVFIFDIDHFKNYNDTNGHVEGDDVLRDVAGLLRNNLRPGDVACRYGGEEFVVAMPRTEAREALLAAERIRRVIEEHPFAHREKQPLGCVSISGGVAVFPFDGTDGVDLVRRADEALYRAKSAGRNRVLVHRGTDFGEGDEAPSTPSQEIPAGPERGA